MVLFLTACLPFEVPLAQSMEPTPSKVVLPTIIPTNTLTPYQPVTPVYTPTVTPTFTPTPCPETEGRLFSAEFPSVTLGKSIPAQVYLPPCYDDIPEGGFPFLLMLHGQIGDQYTWAEVGLIDAANRLIAAGSISRLVIVMPFEHEMWVEPQFSSFPEAVVLDLLPELEAAYPLNPDPAYRAIGGYSRGANWAVRIALSEPGLFGAIGAHSYPSFNGDAQRLSYWMENFSEVDFPRLRIDIGEQDQFLPYARAFEAELTRLKLPHEYLLLPGGHNYAYWGANAEDYLLWYAAAWKEP